MTYHRLSLSDSVSSSISKITDVACEIIDGAIAPKKNGAEGGDRILVHCSAGFSRSPMVVAAYLMKRKGMTLRAARRTDRLRPAADLAECWVSEAAEEMEVELYGSCSLEVEELPKREKDRLEGPRAEEQAGSCGCCLNGSDRDWNRVFGSSSFHCSSY